jgi:tetratricopeptide (TPR) repeat protein
MTDFTPHEAPAHEAADLPVALPPKLIGRDLVLAEIYKQLRDNRAVLIHGAAGVGKTALAATLASAYTDLPGGVLWLELANNLTLADLIVRVGRAYQIPDIAASENPLGMVGATAATLTQHKPLLILDGRFDWQVGAEFITRCAPSLPAIVVQEEAAPGPWTPLELPTLDLKQASLMFRTLAGEDGPNGEDNDVDVGTLVGMLDQLPFAVAVAAGAARANRQPPAEFIAVLQGLGLTGNAPLLALTASFRTLNNALQGLLLMLGATINGSASAELLSLISGAPQPTIEQAMTLLAQRHMVEIADCYGQPLYRLHPITHTFTQPLLRGSGRLDALRAKVRDTLLAYARAHASGSPADSDRLAAEMENFLAVAAWSVENGDRDIANQLAVALMQAGDFINERGYFYELMSMRRLAAPAPTGTGTMAMPFPLPAQEEEPLLDDEEDEEEDYEPLPYEDEADIDVEADEDDALLDDEEDEGEVAAFANQDEPLTEPPPTFAMPPAAAQAAPAPAPAVASEAPAEGDEISRLRATLMQVRQSGDRARQAELLSQLGLAQVTAQMENEAISTFSEALTTYESLNDNTGMLNTLESLAMLTARTDNSQAAVLYATRGVNAAEQLADRARQMRLLALLGDARQQLGESDQAIRAYSQALDLTRAQGDHAFEAVTLFKLGYAQLDDNEPQEAINLWEAALKLFREQERRDYEGRVLGGLGTAYGELGRWSEAIAFHTSALHIAREVKDPEEELLQLSNLGYASVQAQQLGQAVLRYRQALHLAYTSGSKGNIISTIVDLARLLAESRRHLTVAELLVDDALRLEPNDREVRRLKERLDADKAAAETDGVEFIAVSGTAQDYAANAYKLLDA